MKSINVKNATIKETPHGVDVRPIYDRYNAQAVHIMLNPGESLKPHITPVDVFFYVLEGTPDIQVGEETERFETGTLVESPKDIVHCLYNNTDKPARILVVKAPKPTSQSRLF